MNSSVFCHEGRESDSERSVHYIDRCLESAGTRDTRTDLVGRAATRLKPTLALHTSVVRESHVYWPNADSSIRSFLVIPYKAGARVSPAPCNRLK